jgi:hypothetical protein
MSLLQICQSWPKPSFNAKNGTDASAQLDAVEPLDTEYGLWGQAVGPEEEDKIGWGQVDVDMLHAQEGGKGKPAIQQTRLLLCQDQR